MTLDWTFHAASCILLIQATHTDQYQFVFRNSGVLVVSRFDLRFAEQHGQYLDWVIDTGGEQNVMQEPASDGHKLTHLSLYSELSEMFYSDERRQKNAHQDAPALRLLNCRYSQGLI